MELRQLKYFLAVADTRSFVGAANALFVSRQAVSKAIGQLESELGVELLVRESNGAYLSPAGLMFYDRIRSSVMELEQVRSEMQRFGARYHQRVRLAFTVGTMQMYERRLQEFRLEQENLVLEYQEQPEEHCLELLREHKVDMVVCTGQPSMAEFSVQVLAQSPFGVLLQEKDALTSLDSLELQDLSWIPLAALKDGASQELSKHYGLHLQVQGYDLYRLFSMSREGYCAMLLPKCMVPGQFSGVTWLPLENVEPWKLYGVCLKSLEQNILYHTMIEEMQARVFSDALELK